MKNGLRQHQQRLAAIQRRQGQQVHNAQIDGEHMTAIVREKAWERLPENMRACAALAWDTMVHSGDGQMCDAIIESWFRIATRIFTVLEMAIFNKRTHKYLPP